MFHSNQWTGCLSPLIAMGADAYSFDVCDGEERSEVGAIGLPFTLDMSVAATIQDHAMRCNPWSLTYLPQEKQSVTFTLALSATHLCSLVLILCV
jgi:hypothetical protein